MPVAPTRSVSAVAQLPVFLVAHRQCAPSASTITAIAASGLAAAATSARCAKPVDELVGQVDPHHRTHFAALDATSTRDFSGTKPSTAGRAAIRAPGRFRSKSVDAFVMAPTLATGTVESGARRRR